MLNRNALRGLIAVAIFVPASSAMSEGLSYNYIQASYASVSVDLSDFGLPDIDGTGFGFSGSFEISPDLAFTAGYVGIGYELFPGLDLDESSHTIGFTGHTSISPETDIAVNFSILNAGWELSDGSSDDDSGNVISVGIRHLKNKVELGASASRVDVFDDTSNSFGFGARFYTRETLSLGIGYSTSDDTNSFGMNVRLDM
jgi:hypothetical protein